MLLSHSPNGCQSSGCLHADCRPRNGFLSTVVNLNFTVRRESHYRQLSFCCSFALGTPSKVLGTAGTGRISQVYGSVTHNSVVHNWIPPCSFSSCPSTGSGICVNAQPGSGARTGVICGAQKTRMKKEKANLVNHVRGASGRRSNRGGVDGAGGRANGEKDLNPNYSADLYSTDLYDAYYATGMAVQSLPVLDVQDGEGPSSQDVRVTKSAGLGTVPPLSVRGSSVGSDGSTLERATDASSPEMYERTNRAAVSVSTATNEQGSTSAPVFSGSHDDTQAVDLFAEEKAGQNTWEASFQKRLHGSRQANGPPGVPMSAETVSRASDLENSSEKAKGLFSTSSVGVQAEGPDGMEGLGLALNGHSGIHHLEAEGISESKKGFRAEKEGEVGEGREVEEKVDDHDDGWEEKVGQDEDWADDEEGEEEEEGFEDALPRHEVWEGDLPSPTPEEEEAILLEAAKEIEELERAARMEGGTRHVMMQGWREGVENEETGELFGEESGSEVDEEEWEEDDEEDEAEDEEEDGRETMEYWEGDLPAMSPEEEAELLKEMYSEIERLEKEEKERKGQRSGEQADVEAEMLISRGELGNAAAAEGAFDGEGESFSDSEFDLEDGFEGMRAWGGVSKHRGASLGLLPDAQSTSLMNTKVGPSQIEEEKGQVKGESDVSSEFLSAESADFSAEEVDRWGSFFSRYILDDEVADGRGGKEGVREKNKPQEEFAARIGAAILNAGQIEILEEEEEGELGEEEEEEEEPERSCTSEFYWTEEEDEDDERRAQRDVERVGYQSLGGRTVNESRTAVIAKLADMVTDMQKQLLEVQGELEKLRALEEEEGSEERRELRPISIASHLAGRNKVDEERNRALQSGMGRVREQEATSSKGSLGEKEEQIGWLGGRRVDAFEDEGEFCLNKESEELTERIEAEVASVLEEEEKHVSSFPINCNRRGGNAEEEREEEDDDEELRRYEEDEDEDCDEDRPLTFEERVEELSHLKRKAKALERAEQLALSGRDDEDDDDWDASSLSGEPKKRGLPAIMRCFDTARIYAKAGDGGNGVVAFRREKYVPNGGPSGGNGGKGGDVYLRADPSLNSLLPFRKAVHFRAARGVHGQGSSCHGIAGKDMEILVPPGTVVRRAVVGNSDPSAQEEEEVLVEMVRAGQRELLLPGGRGGRGNAAFKTGRNRVPQMAENGEEGPEMWLQLELKLVADVGIIGVPNAGKSTLLSVISSAKPKVANYPFTTLVPNLGVVEVDFRSLVFADVPGLLEGAHQGFGLGQEFLRHTERCRVLVHIIDGTRPQPLYDYEAICNELALFNPALVGKPQVVVFNKADVPEAAEKWENFQEEMKGKWGVDVLRMSAVTGEGTKEVVRAAFACLPAEEEEDVLSGERQVDGGERMAVGDLVRAEQRMSLELFRIDVDRHTRTFRVIGKGIQAFVQMTNWEYFESVKRFQHVLDASGVSKALREAGVRDGDVVCIGKMEYEWKDNDDPESLGEWKRGTRGTKVWPH
eukprot:TRINITY_DN607_c0_g1_i1.p1 TRINITY_DN607_c0_g1~~TRINITY_DN607_c0_g1_i1.p1  ORF type:complete len:1500 (+),score=396.58 TRINITY_DN607_c0_g1_i1:136-4635(+)